MTSLQHVSCKVKGIRVSAQNKLQSLSAHVTRDLKLDAEKPFQEVIDVSTGDPHRAGIKPLSYIRQVLAVCLYPELLGDSNLPDDIRQRALRLLKACDGGSLGSYTASSGMLYCKQRISEFIARRDGVPSNPNDIFIPAGSQRALMIILKLLSNGGEGRPPTGVLTPLPCPHTLPALLDEAEVTLVPFQLSEDRGWAVDPDELRRALKAARGHCQPRAVYISNPGNPTGHVQDRQSIEEVIQLAAAERLLLLVDEVYQDCVYGHGGKFISYKKTLLEMNREFVETVELFSFHSLSGARAGECGLRAGYIEAFNMDPKVKYHLDNLLCGDISTPVTGQLALDLMLNPPTAGDASYDKHIQETVSIQNILSRNAQRGHELLNDLPGMSCQPAMGGIFLYPRLDLPSGFLKQAQILGIEADVLYCQRFLEEEGVLVGAGQDSGPAGNHHLRLSFFVPSESFEVVLARLSSFHLHIMNKWVNNPTLDEFCFTMIGRADIEGSKSDVMMNAWPLATQVFLQPEPLLVNPLLSAKSKVLSRTEISSGMQVNSRVLGIRPLINLQGEIKPFSNVTDVSSGDLQRAGMPPLSFARQVLAVCLYPTLLKENSLPLDVKQRAQTLLGACNGGSVGSYPQTASGIPEVHKSIAEFIRKRDGGVSSHPDDVICSTGSHKSLQLVLHLMSSGVGGTQTGVLTPVPCPHTLPMLLDETGVKQVPYQLTEERGWAVELDELHRALKAGREHCEPRAIYISNPGNPTGHVQERKTMEEIIRFAANEHLVLLAEEVYQDSVYGPDKEFLSYKKVLLEMDTKYSETVEMISFHSISSVCMGEGGLRGGYLEMINLDPSVKQYLRMMQSSSSTVILGQLALEVMVNPPGPGDPSYTKYSQEILHRKETLSHNAQRACDFLNTLRGMSCQPAMAGVFLYPRLHLPQRMITDAKRLGVQADLLYCRRLLEEEGVCLGPGCENGQEEENFHIRLCVFVPAATLDEVLARIRSFHLRLLDKFN